VPHDINKTSHKTNRCLNCAVSPAFRFFGVDIEIGPQYLGKVVGCILMSLELELESLGGKKGFL